MYTRILAKPLATETKESTNNTIDDLHKVFNAKCINLFVRMLDEQKFDINTPVNEQGDTFLMLLVREYAGKYHILKPLYDLLNREPKPQKWNLSLALNELIEIYFQDGITPGTKGYLENYFILLVKHGAELKQNKYLYSGLSELFLNPNNVFCHEFTESYKAATKEKMSETMQLIRKEMHAASFKKTKKYHTEFLTPAQELSLHNAAYFPMGICRIALTQGDSHVFYAALIKYKKPISYEVSKETTNLHKMFCEILGDMRDSYLSTLKPKILRDDKTPPAEAITSFMSLRAECKDDDEIAQINLNIAATYCAIDKNKAIQLYQEILSGNQYTLLHPISREELVSQLFLLADFNQEIAVKLLQEQFAKELQLKNCSHYIILRMTVAMIQLKIFDEGVLQQLLTYYENYLKQNYSEQHANVRYSISQFLKQQFTSAQGENKTQVLKLIFQQLQVELTIPDVFIRPNKIVLDHLWNTLQEQNIFKSLDHLSLVLNLFAKIIADRVYDVFPFIIAKLEWLVKNSELENLRIKTLLIQAYEPYTYRSQEKLKKACDLIVELPKPDALDHELLVRYAESAKSTEHCKLLIQCSMEEKNSYAVLCDKYRLAKIIKESNRPTDEVITHYQIALHDALQEEDEALLEYIAKDLFEYVNKIGGVLEDTQKVKLAQMLQQIYAKFDHAKFIAENPEFTNTMFDLAVTEKNLKKCWVFIPLKGVLDILEKHFGENLGFLAVAKTCEPKKIYIEKENFISKLQAQIDARFNESKLSLKQKFESCIELVKKHGPNTTIFICVFKHLINLINTPKLQYADFAALFSPMIHPNVRALHEALEDFYHREYHGNGVEIINIEYVTSKVIQFKIEHAETLEKARIISDIEFKALYGFQLNTEQRAQICHLPAIATLTNQAAIAKGKQAKNLDIRTCLSILTLMLTKESDFANKQHLTWNLELIKPVNQAIFAAKQYLLQKTADPLVQHGLRMIGTYDSKVNPFVFLFLHTTDKIMHQRIMTAARQFLKLDNEDEWVHWQSMIMHSVSLERLTPAPLSTVSKPSAPVIEEGTIADLSGMVKERKEEKSFVVVEEDEAEPGMRVRV